MSTELIRRENIAELVAHRDAALDKFGQAYDLLVDAGKEVRRAGPTGYFKIPEAWRGHSWYDLPDSRDEWMKRQREATDRCVWDHLIKFGQFESLMDTTAREQFRKQLADNPPELTVDNCYATLHQLMLDSGMIFKRGVAVAFSKLDRRFRSHDGFKIGSRIILRVHNGDGMSLYGWDEERLRDIERVFCTLDGRPMPEYGALPRRGADEPALAVPICNTIRSAYSYSKPNGNCEDDFFRVNIFKNGNAHLYFKRDDLVRKVNLILADYYGANLGDDSKEARNKYTPGQNVTAAKNLGWFETPASVAEQVVEHAKVTTYSNEGTLQILEPSAGEGALIKRVLTTKNVRRCKFHAIEVHPERARKLRSLGVVSAVAQENFLEVSPIGMPRFDRVVMNPPFDRGQDIDHVLHALDFLAQDGILVAVMSASAEFSTTKKAEELRSQMERRKGYFVDLPEGSFKDAGTMVNTVLCVIGRGRW